MNEQAVCIVMNEVVWKYWPGAVMPQGHYTSAGEPTQGMHFQDLAAFRTVNTFTYNMFQMEILHLMTFFILLSVTKSMSGAAHLSDAEAMSGAAHVDKMITCYIKLGNPPPTQSKLRLWAAAMLGDDSD